MLMRINCDCYELVTIFVVFSSIIRTLIQFPILCEFDNINSNQISIYFYISVTVELFVQCLIFVSKETFVNITSDQ